MARRDRLKEQDYFDEQAIFNATKALEEFRAIITKPDTALEHREQLRHTVFRRELEQLIIRYSRGEPAALRSAFPLIVSALAEYQQQAGTASHDSRNFDAYIYALWIASLAILLEVADPDLGRAVKELDHEGHDALFDRLVALRIPGRTQIQTLIYPRPYEPHFQALDASGESRTNLIENFLEGYYDGMQGAYWYDSHLRDDGGFFGYWSFELAAFVKVLKIDDAAFADNPYYPRDLVRPPTATAIKVVGTN